MKSKITPNLFSYIQIQVDETKKKGFFIITGSQNFYLNQQISQSLAGRIYIYTLLPLSLGELDKADLFPQSIEQAILNGGYPRIYHDHLKPSEWIPNYIHTYIEKDIRQLKNITNLCTFENFLKLCAGRVGQLLNITSLSNDCGISPNTAKSWISLLEASYILFLLPPYFHNFSKRLIKSPKLYFYDTAIVCSLLGLEKEKDLSLHYLKGSLFESLIISELLKQRFSKGFSSHLYFYRDKVGNEIDVVFGQHHHLTAMEIKSSKTLNQSFFYDLLQWKKSYSGTAELKLIYSGKDSYTRSNIEVLSWEKLAKEFG